MEINGKNTLTMTILCIPGGSLFLNTAKKSRKCLPSIFPVSLAKWGTHFHERICSQSSPYDKGGKSLLLQEISLYCYALSLNTVKELKTPSNNRQTQNMSSTKWGIKVFFAPFLKREMICLAWKTREPSDDTYQPEHPRTLIGAFSILLNRNWIFGFAKSFSEYSD